ncbi:MAG: hypothetical protein ACK5M3_09260 [Dysgonomonas sp.]
MTKPDLIRKINLIIKHDNINKTENAGAKQGLEKALEILESNQRDLSGLDELNTTQARAIAMFAIGFNNMKLIEVNQSKFITLSGKTSWGLLMQNQQTTITPSYIIGVWSPFTTTVSDILTSTLGDDGALLVEKTDIGIPTFWRIGFEFEMGNNPPTQTRYFKVDIVDNDSGSAVFSQAIVVPGGLDTGHTAPFSLFFSTLSDTAANHKGYKIVFGVDTAASAGLPNNISVRVTRILKID